VKPPPFAYVAPTELAAALELLHEEGPEAKLLAGGQSLMPLLNMRLARPRLLVDLNRIPGLDGVAVREEAILLGAMVRHRVLRSAPVASALPVLGMAAAHIGHFQIQNRGTLGGSLAHDDPAAELPLVLRLLDGEVEVASSAGGRRIAAQDFFVSYLTTALHHDEAIVAVRLLRPAGRVGFAFCEVARRSGDFALVAVAAAVSLAGGRIASLRLALGGVGPVPVRPKLAEAAAVGLAPGPRLQEEVVEAALTAIEPDSDLHASAAYRRTLTRTLIRRALAEAVRRAGEEEER
jgi:CO/xanthine dehydrogenase FAD-binding subunit